jgi:hypothetical protein
MDLGLIFRQMIRKEGVLPANMAPIQIIGLYTSYSYISTCPRAITGIQDQVQRVRGFEGSALVI